MKSRATKKDARYVLNGSKTFITNAPIADVMIVFAITDEAKSHLGLSAFVVERDTPGLVVGRNIERMGLRTAMVGELSFDECELPAESLLGREGAGAAIFNSEMGWERCCLFACRGSHAAAAETAVRYAKDRRQISGSRSAGSDPSPTASPTWETRIRLSRLILYKRPG
jgi:alkylation response protein AidB-like acyl-CoA dehydrogenase